jgi:putative ABC transport system substrate-binding protein
MRRRDFVTLLAGAAATWPMAARAQQAERMRRIGALMNWSPSDPEGQARLAAFLQGLQEFGWTVGRNARIDIRWAAADVGDVRKYAAELVAFGPDAILASGGSVVGPLLQATRTVPIVFTQTPDPVGAGYVASLARPGGNATGFTSSEYGMSGKWLELLKEIAPHVTRAAVLRLSYLAPGQRVSARFAPPAVSPFANPRPPTRCVSGTQVPKRCRYIIGGFLLRFSVTHFQDFSNALPARSFSRFSWPLLTLLRD